MNLSEIEQKHDRLQWFSFVGVTLGSLAFALQELVDMLGGHAEAHFALTMAGGVGWVLACWAIMSTTSLTKHEAIKAILEDERMAANRSSAFEFALAAILVAQLVLMVASAAMTKYTAIEMTVGFATNLSIAVAFIVAYGRFVYLNR